MSYDRISANQNVYIQFDKKREMAAIFVEMHVSSIASLIYFVNYIAGRTDNIPLDDSEYHTELY